MITVAVDCETTEIAIAYLEAMFEVKRRLVAASTRQKPVKYGESIVETALKLRKRKKRSTDEVIGYPSWNDNPIITHAEPAIIKPKRKRGIKISPELMQAERDAEKTRRELAATVLPLIQKQTEELILGKRKKPSRRTHAKKA